ncbi:MAG TPA: N-acetyltransferase [Blastocatellia bacterium]|nr:N-acetyltransferase [Blastocatellia bacterium]
MSSKEDSSHAGVAAATAAGALTVKAVTSGRDKARFIDLPYRLYRRNDHWVAPLRMSQKDILNTSKHPFYKTSDVEMYLAERDGRAVGRIMAIFNRAHNEFHQEKAGHFGFFEVEKDFEAASALVDAAAAWLRGRGAECIRGPFNPSTNYECGLLVDAFDKSPRIMMTYNQDYYAAFLERCGLTKAMDLYAYDIHSDSFNMSDKLKRVAERTRVKDGITVRTVNMKDFEREVQRIREVYNDAWSRNWGFVPVSPEEFEHLARDLKQIVDPRVVMIAERKEEGRSEPRPVGFFLAVPDLNLALKKVPSGRLLPFGILKLLYYSRKINTMRIITMGGIKEYQSLGLGALFYDEIYSRGPQSGYPKGEMSWVLENNVLMNRAALMLGGHKTRTYRIYEKSLK